MAKAASAASIEVGQAAPEFTLPDQDGRSQALKGYRGRWVALYFYPKDDTPGCTKEACSFRDAEARLHERDVVVLGVSPDSVASHRRFADKFSLAFPLLADEDHRVCERYGVWREKTNFGRRYMGVMRTTFLIDPKGRVAHRWDKVEVAGHADQVLSGLREAAAD